MNIAIQKSPKLTEHPWRREIAQALISECRYYDFARYDDFLKVERISRIPTILQHCIWHHTATACSIPWNQLS